MGDLTEVALATLRATVYQTLADEGRASSPGELARRLALQPRQVLAGLTVLAERHALVLTQDGDAIRMAHPFSATPMALVVAPADGRDDRRSWGGCAQARDLDLPQQRSHARPEPDCRRVLPVETGATGVGPSTLARRSWSASRRSSRHRGRRLD